MFSRSIIVRYSSNSVDGVRFDDTAMNAIRAAHRRKWTTIGSLIALGAVGIGVFVYSSWSKDRDDALVNGFTQADRLFQSENEMFMQAAQKPGADLTKLVKPDHSASAKKFSEFITKNPGHPLAWVAGLRAASEFVETGKSDEAISVLEGLLPRTMNVPLMQVRVRRTLAGLYADKGLFPKALAELDVLEKMSDNPVLSENRLFRAKVLFLSGDKENSGKLLRELSNSPELSAVGDRSSVATEASLWLGHWGL